MKPAGAVIALVLLCLPPVAHASAWINQGPFGGRINALAVDPLDQRRVVVGSDAGIFESRDSGVTWRKQHDVAGFEVSHIVIDPQTPSTMYAAYGALESYFILLFRNSRLFKTTDGGETWVPIENGLPGSKSIAALILDPGDPAKLWVGLQCGIRSFKGEPECDPCSNAGVTTAEGVYRSSDGGASWEFSSSGLSGEGLCVRGLTLDPRSDVLYGYSEVLVSYWMTKSSVSSDDGATWGPAANPSPTSSVLIHPAQPFRRFALQGGANGGAVLVSEDGTSWRSISDELTRLLLTSFNGIALDPGDASGLFVATDRGVYRTNNLGTNWVLISPPAIGHTYNVARTSDGPIYIGSATGLLISRDDGVTWNVADVRHIATSIDEVEVDPTDANTLLARVIDYNHPLTMMRSHDGGATWNDISAGLPRIEGSGFPFQSRPILAIDGGGNAYLVASLGLNGAGSAIFTLPRGGTTWTQRSLPAQYPQFVVASPSQSGLVWAFVHPAGVYRSTNGGATWEKTADIAPGVNLRAAGLDPAGPTLYATANGRVYRSADGGTTWANVFAGDFYKYSVSAADGTIYGYQCCDALFRSANGLSWERVSLPGSDMRGVAADPKRAGVVYAWSVHNGVFRSTDGGRTWARFDEGLTTGRINWLTMDTLGRKLYAATFRDGIFWRMPEATGRQRSVRR